MTDRSPRLAGRIAGDIAGPNLICIALALADTPANRAFAARFPIPAIVGLQDSAIRPADHFRMLPGYANLQPVAAGEVLARDRHGPVHAPESGRILMPLYQERGNDGFFVAGETSPVRS